MEGVGFIWAPYSPDGRRIAVPCGPPGTPGEVKVFDAATGQPSQHRLFAPSLLTLRGHKEPVLRVAYSPDGTLIASTSGTFEVQDDKIVNERGEAKLWNANTGVEVHTLGGHVGMVWGLAFSPDSRLVAPGAGRNTFDSKGDFLEGTGDIKLWDAKAGASLVAFRGHSRPVECLAFNNDGTRLASSSEDMTVKVWDVSKVAAGIGK